MHLGDSPYSLNGLGIPGNIWFRRFAVTYIHREPECSNNEKVCYFYIWLWVNNNIHHSVNIVMVKLKDVLDLYH